MKFFYKRRTKERLNALIKKCWFKPKPHFKNRHCFMLAVNATLPYLPCFMQDILCLQNLKDNICMTISGKLPLIRQSISCSQCKLVNMAREHISHYSSCSGLALIKDALWIKNIQSEEIVIALLYNFVKNMSEEIIYLEKLLAQVNTILQQIDSSMLLYALSLQKCIEECIGIHAMQKDKKHCYLAIFCEKNDCMRISIFSKENPLHICPSFMSMINNTEETLSLCQFPNICVLSSSNGIHSINFYFKKKDAHAVPSYLELEMQFIQAVLSKYIYLNDSKDFQSKMIDVYDKLCDGSSKIIEQVYDILHE